MISQETSYHFIKDEQRLYEQLFYAWAKPIRPFSVYSCDAESFQDSDVEGHVDDGKVMAGIMKERISLWIAHPGATYIRNNRKEKKEAEVDEVLHWT